MESHFKSPFLRKCNDQSQRKLYPVAPTTATKFKTMLDLLKRDSMQNEKYFLLCSAEWMILVCAGLRIE